MRRVWAAVTQDPQASLKSLAERVGCSYSRVGVILKDLRAAGYIDFQDRTNGARTIVLPFSTGARIRRAETNKAAGEGG